MPTTLIDFVKENTKSFDESHDVNHALAVYKNALHIARVEYPQFDNEILEFSSLLHDVCDHKYKDSIPKEQLNLFIHDSLPKEKADAVIDIINNISYSQQIKGKRKTLNHPYNIYQDILSDADKLEALGEIGLRRCILYTESINGKVPQDVIKHSHEKLLRLKDNFIVTKTGKQLAEPLHKVIQDYVDKYSN
jgi:uncharacterized protein